MQTYEEIILNSFRYLGFTSLYDIETLTLEEYGLRIKAYRLKQVDKEYDMFLQAWLNHQVTAMKEQGKKQVPVYKEFKQFFNYEKRLSQVFKTQSAAISPEHDRLAEIAKHVNAGKEVKNG